MSRNKFLLLALFLGFALFTFLSDTPLPPTSNQEISRTDTSASISRTTSSTNNTITKAFNEKRSGVQVEDSGEVIQILKDDNEGSRHQRFILRLASGNSLLIAHNIDLAPRIDKLQKGDRVAFYGVYEYNKKGGVVHWTHHDPRKYHRDGWLKHQNRLYE